MIYVGFEVILIFGQIEVGCKIMVCGDSILLEVVIYDLELIMGFFFGMSLISGLNVMVYVVEVFYVQDCNFVFSLMVVEGLVVFK